MIQDEKFKKEVAEELKKMESKLNFESNINVFDIDDIYFNSVKLNYRKFIGTVDYPYEVARHLIGVKDSIIYRNRDIDNQTTQGNKERQDEPPINNNHVQIPGVLDTINEVYEDDEESEKEKKCVQKKLKLAKNGSVRHKKLWMFDKKEERDNCTFRFNDKTGKIDTEIGQGGYFKVEGLKVINGNKKSVNTKPSTTKITHGGKNYTFFCK